MVQVSKETVYGVEERMQKEIAKLGVFAVWYRNLVQWKLLKIYGIIPINLLPNEVDEAPTGHLLSSKKLPVPGLGYI